MTKLTLADCVKQANGRTFVRGVHQCKMINGILYDINDDTLTMDNVIQLSEDDILKDDWKILNERESYES